METDERRNVFYNWLKNNLDKIKYARKGSSDILMDEYNTENPYRAITDKKELWRWLYYYRRKNNIYIHYCPTKRQYVRSRPEHSNYIRE